MIRRNNVGCTHMYAFCSIRLRRNDFHREKKPALRQEVLTLLDAVLRGVAGDNWKSVLLGQVLLL